MASAKYLNLSGLTTFWNKVKTLVSGKADKKVPSAANNVALLDSNGNLVDSGKTLGKSVPSDAVFTDTTYTNEKLGQGYVTCSTAAATAAKVGTLSNYVLVKGGIVAVKFTYAVGASATLNINSKGAKSIYNKGAAITSGVIAAGDIAYLMYDGTNYNLLGTDRAASNPIINITRSGTTFTATRLDGSTFTFNQQDNNTTYSAGTGLSLSGTTFSANLDNTVTSTSTTKAATANAVKTAYDLANAAVPKTRTVNGHALSGNVTVSKSDIGLDSISPGSRTKLTGINIGTDRVLDVSMSGDVWNTTIFVMYCAGLGNGMRYPIMLAISFRYVSGAFQGSGVPKMAILYNTSVSTGDWAPELKYNGSHVLLNLTKTRTHEAQVTVIVSSGDNSKISVGGCLTTDSLWTEASEASGTEMCLFTSSPGSATGSVSVPVYFGPNGFVNECTKVNADTVDNYHISVGGSLPSSPKTSTLYFV